jgi:hypothetical protein
LDEETATLIPWLLEEATQAANSNAPYAAGKLTLAAQLLGERRPATEPEPQGPIPEAELAAMWNQQADSFNQWESLDSGEQLAWAQARALARWGRPAVKPVPNGGVAFNQKIDEIWCQAGGDINLSPLTRIAFAEALITKYASPAIEPVSVAERPPGPEDFHPKNDWCWGWYGWRWRMMDSTCFYPGCNASHYVPHWALPVPQQEATQ